MITRHYVLWLAAWFMVGMPTSYAQTREDQPPWNCTEVAVGQLKSPVSLWMQNGEPDSHGFCVILYDNANQRSFLNLERGVLQFYRGQTEVVSIPGSADEQVFLQHLK